MNEVKTGKLPMIAALFILAIFSEVLYGGKNMVDFCSTIQNSTNFFYVGSLNCE